MIYEKLLKVQAELKAPKGQYNSFGKYKYRSCEDILEAIKPLAVQNKCVLNISDKLVYIGDRYYIEATATLTDIEDNTSASNTGYAREEEIKKGMDGSQITGTASSYARKYALNGLFCIDDTKDSDTDEFKKNQDKPQEKLEEKYISALESLLVQKGVTTATICKKYGVETLADLSMQEFTIASGGLQKMADKLND